jgi:hypothetical protein
MGGDTLQFLHDLTTNRAKHVIKLFTGLGLTLSVVRIELRLRLIQSRS